MPKLNLVEIHVQGMPETTAVTADQLMRAAQAKGYEVRAGKGIEGIKSGDGWFAIDCGSREREQAETEIQELIAGINGGSDILSIEKSGQPDYGWKLQPPQ